MLIMVAIVQSFSNGIQESLPRYTPSYDFGLIDFIYRLNRAVGDIFCIGGIEYILLGIIKWGKLNGLWLPIIGIGFFLLAKIFRWIAIKVNNLEAYARDKEYKM